MVKKMLFFLLLNNYTLSSYCWSICRSSALCSEMYILTKHKQIWAKTFCEKHTRPRKLLKSPDIVTHGAYVTRAWVFASMLFRLTTSVLSLTNKKLLHFELKKKNNSSPKYWKSAHCCSSVSDEHSQRFPTICFSLLLERASVHECSWVMHLCRKSERNKGNVYLGGLASVLLERFLLKGPASCTYTPFLGHFPLQCWSLSLLSPCHSHSRPRHC